MDKYARQRGLVAQDILADAVITILGTGPALPYLLQCLVLAGVATRHGEIRLSLPDRPVLEPDLAWQFLLRPDDLGKPLREALINRAREMDDGVIMVPSYPDEIRGIGVAVPAAGELDQIREDASIAIWGQVLSTAIFVGPAPMPEAGPDGPTVFTAALAAVCGGLLAQAVLRQIGALIDGPRFLSSWLEERLWITHPGIGNRALAAIAEGAESPSLRGLLESLMAPEVAERVMIETDGRIVDARITAIIDRDTVVATVPAARASESARLAVTRSHLTTPGPVQPLLWSPIEATEKENLPDSSVLPKCRVVLCGAGALGSWAASVIAASRLPDVAISIVDMDESVEVHNLNRQVLFGPADIGQPKARSAAARLHAIRPDMELTAHQVVISPDLIDELIGNRLDYEIADPELIPGWAAYRARIAALSQDINRATVILSCPDNHQTRWSLNVLSETLGLPLVNGAVDGFVGRVHVSDPSDNGRCLVCWLGESIASQPERHSCTDVFDPVPVPSIVTSAAVIGGAQVALLIAQLAGLSGRVRRYHAFDGMHGTLTGYRAADRDSDECPAHLLREGSHGSLS